MSNQNFKEKIAIPYAEALIDYAQSVNLLNETTKDLSSILTILSESQDLRNILLNPLINSSVKKETLKQVFQHQIIDFVMDFIFILVDKRRIFLLSNIIEKYLELLCNLESTIVAELYCASDITEVQQDNVVQKIKLMTDSINVKLVVVKDPNLIGGFVIKIGSKIIDASLSGKLKKMSLYLETN